MEIAMIGAGSVGRALATSALRAGHGVTLGASRSERVEEVEGMVLLHITLQVEYGWPWQSAIKLVGPTG